MPRSAAVLAAALTLVAVAPSGPAAAADVGPPSGVPPVSGCPASNTVLDVAELTAVGYRLPAQLDAAGNQNGTVCGKPMNPQAQQQFCLRTFGGACPVPVIYYFSEDDLAAAD